MCELIPGKRPHHGNFIVLEKECSLSCDVRNILGIARPATSGRHAILDENPGGAFLKKNALCREMSGTFLELPARQLRGGMPFLTNIRGVRLKKKMQAFTAYQDPRPKTQGMPVSLFAN